ncbi:Alpha-N-acetylglucosaminidase [Hondaea fermentalgiana]|uniref:Alpha-N-acetylglucosaminidase n=1 Tax=Hondaea fermentalgiana TaxID=2315210 RepID=A0A2R5GQ28_9STRA|nr:Alpha-N-acetylglucosaminidase [Hondaea fermentalgiana]|eukprot:GBG30723.1 Alpha-N-acetylglucosaminidase [Hondaea fermentalgiana]
MKAGSRVSLFVLLLTLGILLVTPPSQAYGKITVYEAKKANEFGLLATAYNVLARVLGDEVAACIELEQLNREGGGKDSTNFELSRSEDGQKLKISGKDGVTMLSGAYHYMRWRMNASVTWSGLGNDLIVENPIRTRDAFVETLVGLNTPVRVSARGEWSYYMQPCTNSYSSAFWTAERWLQEIDWMALHGVTHPTMYMVYEPIWQRILDDLNETSAFPGPAFLGWFRMGNMEDTWAGPAPRTYINRQAGLAQILLRRMRALGMFPILPGFSGSIPCSLRRHFPNATIVSMPWEGFRASCFLDGPSSSATFEDIGQRYYHTLQELFGSDHVYAIDHFNEMTPVDGSTRALARTSELTYQVMSAADSSAVWVMQGWFLRERYGCRKANRCNKVYWNQQRLGAYFSSIPRQQLVVLDLNASEQSLSYDTYGFLEHYFLTCIIHVFGGNRGIHGNLTSLATLYATAQRDYPANALGVGLAMEAIEADPIVFEIFSESRWGTPGTFGLAQQTKLHPKTPPNLTFPLALYVDNWANSRYSADVDARVVHGLRMLTHAAWGLYSSAYDNSDSGAIVSFPFGHRGCCSANPNILHLVPGQVLKPQHPGGQRHGIKGEANASWAFSSAKEIVHGARQTTSPLTRGLEYDLIDLVRQVMDHIFWDLCRIWEASVGRRDHHEARSLRAALLEQIDEADELLSSSPDWLLGRWIARAREYGTANVQDANLFEYNARNQVTRWGRDAQHSLNDYARKYWAGLLSGFYKIRWDIATNEAIFAMQFNRTVDIDAARERCEEFEVRWQRNFHDQYPNSPQGNALAIAGRFFDKINAHSLTSRLQGWTMAPSARLTAQPAWHRNHEVLSYFCDMMRSCAGFSTEGYFFSSTQSSLRIPAPGVVLYVKTASTF